MVNDHHLDHDEELNHKEIMHHMLHSRPVHITVLSLVLLDTIFVLFELLIDFKVINLDYHSNPIPHMLHGFSIAILGIFVIEICMKLYAEFNHFIHHKIEMLDGIVVFISFGLDVFTAFVHDKKINWNSRSSADFQVLENSQNNKRSHCSTQRSYGSSLTP